MANSQFIFAGTACDPPFYSAMHMEDDKHLWDQAPIWPKSGEKHREVA